MQIWILSGYKKSSSALHTANQKGDTKTVHHPLKDRAGVNLHVENETTPDIACKKWQQLHYRMLVIKNWWRQLKHKR